jgi:predicted DNA-binding transcriptional regulator AlpA
MDTNPSTQVQKDGVNRSVNVNNLKPEWIRVPDAVRISGICRSAIYELINSGAIRSFSHKKRGAVLGQRLISYDSLVDYLNRAYRTSCQANASSEEGGCHE